MRIYWQIYCNNGPLKLISMKHWIENECEGYRSQYSDSLRAGRSGDRMPMGRDIPHPSRPALGTIPSVVQLVLGLSPEGKATGLWRWPPTPSNAQVKETVDLYLCFYSGPSRPVLGWTLPLPLPLHYMSLFTGIWCIPYNYIWHYNICSCTAQILWIYTHTYTSICCLILLPILLHYYCCSKIPIFSVTSTNFFFLFSYSIPWLPPIKAPSYWPLFQFCC